MTDLPLATDPPFEFVEPEHYDDERDLRRAANERARYLARVHDLRDPVAWTVAIAEQGAAVPRRIGSTEATVAGYLDEVEARFGFQATVWKPPEERTGPLDADGGGSDGNDGGNADGDGDGDHEDGDPADPPEVRV